ncbi:MAG: ribose-phosphate diphosphokinase [Rhodoferax sp.]|nr:ribose-phosphate diphosphokinase [Rhodoferax sp.]
MHAPGLLLHFGDQADLATRLADAARLDLAGIEVHRFPDGESRLTLPAYLPARVVMLRTLNDPNTKLVELLLASRAARELGALHLTLVAPYLGYMRQDTAFHPGEAVSQRIIGDWLATLFDALITVDPHLHRVSTLQQAVPVAQAHTLSATALLSDWIVAQRAHPLLIGPDAESLQWVSAAAKRHRLDFAACQKTRRGDRDVHILLPGIPVDGRAVVLLDDVASTGHTLAQAAQALRLAGAASVDVAVTHALFLGDGLEQVRQAGVQHIWSTDCLPHASNCVSVASLIGQTLQSH